MLGGLFPLVAVVHGLGEGVFLLPVVVAHRLVAGCPVLVAGGAVVVAVLAGCLGFGVLGGWRSARRRGRRAGPVVVRGRRGGVPTGFRWCRCRG